MSSQEYPLLYGFVPVLQLGFVTDCHLLIYFLIQRGASLCTWSMCGDSRRVVLLFGLLFGCARPPFVTAGFGARRDGIKIAIICSPSGLSTFSFWPATLKAKAFQLYFPQTRC